MTLKIGRQRHTKRARLNRVEVNVIHRCRLTAEFFKGRKWSELTTEDARNHHGALNLFTPAALQYFIPAFMLASIESYDRKLDIIPDSIRANFEFVLHHKEYFDVKGNKWTQAQKRTITEFFRLMESKGAGSAEDAIGELNEEAAT